MPGIVTCVSQDTTEGRQVVYRMLTEKGMEIKEWLNREILVVNFLASRASFTDEETGELVQTVVTRLLLEDGSWIETHSAGVFKSLEALTYLHGLPPWQKPVKVIPKSEAIKNGRNWYVLKLVVEAQPAKGKGR